PDFGLLLVWLEVITLPDRAWESLGSPRPDVRWSGLHSDSGVLAVAPAAQRFGSGEFSEWCVPDSLDWNRAQPGGPPSDDSSGDRFLLCRASVDHFALPRGRWCFADSRTDPRPTTAISAGIRRVTSALRDYDFLAHAEAILAAFRPAS